MTVPIILQVVSGVYGCACSPRSLLVGCEALNRTAPALAAIRVLAARDEAEGNVLAKLPAELVARIARFAMRAALRRADVQSRYLRLVKRLVGSRASQWSDSRKEVARTLDAIREHCACLRSFHVDLIIQSPAEFDSILLHAEPYPDDADDSDGFGPSQDLLRYHRFHLSIRLSNGPKLTRSEAASTLPSAHSTLNTGYTEDYWNSRVGMTCQDEVKLDLGSVSPRLLSLFKSVVDSLELRRPRHSITTVTLAASAQGSSRRAGTEPADDTLVPSMPEIFILHDVR